jgi:tripartite-type tricarboxylate transporter receptor subunit TctC
MTQSPPPRRIAIAMAILWLGLIASAGCQRESRFPDSPISLICPWSAGGGTDRVARQVAAQLETELGVPVNVINATGGGGVTGHTRGARARGDGYTLTMVTVELNMLHWRGLTNLTYQDFAPLQMINRDPAALFVRGDAAYGSLDDLQKAIAGGGTKLKASGTAYGGIWHIATAGWLDSRGLPVDAVNWISINGAGPSIQELLAGGVDFICCSLPEAEAVLSGGQVRCLGVMADARLGGYGEVPTFREQQHDWAMAGWRGIAAPRDTPSETLELLAGAIDRVTRDRAFVDFMAASGFVLELQGPDDFAQTLRQQDELFGDILTQPAFGSVAGEHFGPMMFPIGIAVALVVTLGVVVAQARRERHATGVSEWVGQSAAERSLDAAAAERSMGGPLVVARPASRFGPLVTMAGIMAAILFYGFASERLGFVATATLMLAGLMTSLRVRPAVAGLVAVVAGGLTYQLFGVWLRVPLPRQWLEW